MLCLLIVFAYFMGGKSLNFVLTTSNKIKLIGWQRASQKVWSRISCWSGSSFFLCRRLAATVREKQERDPFTDLRRLLQSSDLTLV